MECEFERRSFLRYAVENWSQHVRESQEKFDLLASRFPSFFDLSSGTCTRSIACRKWKTRAEWRSPVHKLIIACREGILPWVKFVHETHRRTAIYQSRRSQKLKEFDMLEAIFNRRDDIVVWLLDHGYDVNSRIGIPYLGVERLPTVLVAFILQSFNLVDILVQRGATLYEKPFHNDLIQAQRSHGFETRKTWLLVFIFHCAEYAGPRAHPSLYDWLLLCIQASWNETIRLLLKMGVEFPRQYSSSISSCALEIATRSRVETDIRTSLIQRVIDGDERYQRSRGVKGHAHSQSECGAPRQAVFHGRVSVLESLLDNDCFLSSIRSDPRVWSAAFGVAASPKRMSNFTLFIDQFPQGYCAGDDPERNDAPLLNFCSPKALTQTWRPTLHQVSRSRTSLPRSNSEVVRIERLRNERHIQ
jgi:hypothetical protein